MPCPRACGLTHMETMCQPHGPAAGGPPAG